MLTTFDLDEYVYEALRAGASGFLLKDTAPDRLVDAVHAWPRRRRAASARVTRRLVERFAGAPASDAGAGRSTRSPPASARCSC